MEVSSERAVEGGCSDDDEPWPPAVGCLKIPKFLGVPRLDEIVEGESVGGESN
jgi:hypothetical protein